MKKIITILLSLSLVCNIFLVFACADEGNEVNESISTVLESMPDIASGYLIETTTGTVLFAKNELYAQSPASVTKIMTLLLVCEALEANAISLDDMVTVSSYAASMGGSQVFLEEGERFSVEELIKCTVIASANDAAVALAELVSGSESEFVKKMNDKAKELGLSNTNFENTTGLDDTTENHYSCASDIGKMSVALIKHDVILKYSSIWQDTIRDGEFTLTNTNRLVRYYDGCNGLKTGSTDKAGYCVSATAKRGNMQLVAVVMGAKTRDQRNEAARMMLDFGFANYALAEFPEKYLENIPVLSGKADSVSAYTSGFYTVLNRAESKKVEERFDIPETLTAPILEGDKIGAVKYYLNGAEIGECRIYAGESIDKISFSELFIKIFKIIISGS